MNLIDAAMRRSRTVILSLLVVLIGGVVAYATIPKEAEPDIEIPVIYVSIEHDGISPEDSERLLVRPMEQEMRSIEGVKEMTASAYEGGANVQLEFDAGIDTKQALQDVREKVDLARAKLPGETDEPTVQRSKNVAFRSYAGAKSRRRYTGTLADRDRERTKGEVRGRQRRP